MSDIQNKILEDDYDIISEWQNREHTREDEIKAVRDVFINHLGKSEEDVFEATTFVNDYATGEEITFKTCKDKYGKALTQKMLQATEGKKDLELETLQQIKEIHSGERLALKDEEPKAAVKGKPKVKYDKVDSQFVPMPFELLDNDDFKKQFKGLYLTYAFLRRYIIREPVKYDKLNLYENYFLKGELASSWAIGKLANELGCSPTTIGTHLKKLKKSGCIKVVKVPAKDAWDNQPHNIYVLGTHDVDGNKKYFIDNVFGMPPVPEGQGVQ